MPRAKPAKKRYQYMSWDPQAFTDSLFVRNLAPEVELSYRRLLDEAWKNEKQAYLPYDENDLSLLKTATRCTSLEQFKEHWEILKQKWKIVKIHDKTYIYNPIGLRTYKFIANKSKSGRKGGIKRAKNADKRKREEIRKGITIPFSKSKYHDKQEFANLITSEKQYADVNIEHYYLKFSKWANNRYQHADTWPNGIFKFLIRDQEARKLVTNKTEPDAKLNGHSTKGKKELSVMERAVENTREAAVALKKKYNIKD